MHGPGHVWADVSLPNNYVRQDFAIRRGLDIGANETEHVVPDIEATLAAELRGHVLDDHGGRASGATVQADWTHHQGATAGMMRYSTASTDERGEFVLQGIDPDQDIRLEAWLGE